MFELDKLRSPWHPSHYRLLDFGNGRKLEQFGAFLLDRPAPAAEGFIPQWNEPWSKAQVLWPGRIPADFDHPWELQFSLASSLHADDTIAEGSMDPGSNNSPRMRFIEPINLSLQLKLTAFGHVGLFPEQAENWLWLYQHARRAGQRSREPLRCLNLFAYTGGATLALAAGGGHAVHIDASAPAVQWAKRNAALSQLDGHPIRWIVEDAFKFVQREIRRGKQYDLIVLDPPGYGHTPLGRAWTLEDRWQELLEGCLELLTASHRAALLWTAHSPTPSMHEVQRQIQKQYGHQWCVQFGRNHLVAATGQCMDQGYCIRALKRNP